MDKAQRVLSIQKLDIILDNRNNPVNTIDFVKKLESNKRLRDIYLYNIEIWIIYFRKQLAQKSIEPHLIENKLIELLRIAEFFPKEKWPKLYRSIKDMEELIEKT